jgi:hemerythrin-like domain-containing protein
MPTKKNAISLLKEDHKRVSELLEKLSSTTARGSKNRTTLLETIEDELKVHTTIEEEIFYPAYRDAARKQEDARLYLEALEEHHLVDLVLAEMRDTQPDSENFLARAKVLKDVVEHHVEEEEGEMFPRARKLLDNAELTELAERMEERKEELVGEPASAR